MQRILLGLFVLGLTAQSFAQIIKPIELSEVVVYATNYKYLHSLASAEPAPLPVQMLERKVAAFNLKDSEYYQDDSVPDHQRENRSPLQESRWPLRHKTAG